jgi:hypothetical protein
MRIASEFGLTPASRSRIAAPAKASPSLFDLITPLDDEAGARVETTAAAGESEIH